MTTYSGDAIFGIIYNQFKDELPKPIWPKKQWSTATAIRFVVDNAIKSRHTANTVLKQAGLPKKF